MRHTLHPLLSLAALLLLNAGCASTDVIPSDRNDSAKVITLNVSAPEAYGFTATTRAGESFKLRLTASLYAVGNNRAPMETVETIYDASGTLLSFNIEETGDYYVTVFADYIPATTTATSGHFNDYYYDTTQPGTISVKGDRTDFFNNDSRDCFAGKAVFTKGTATLTKDLTLKRPVSRVEVSAPADDVENLVARVDVTACSHFDSYSFALDNTVAIGTVSNTTAAPVAMENVVANLVPDGKRLLYFYTFAATSPESSRPALGEIKFDVAPKENVALTNSSRSIPANLIKPLPNHHISVKGAKGWIDAATTGDDIVITLEMSEDWDSSQDI